VSKEALMCEKRLMKETLRRELQRRQRKETYKRDLQRRHIKETPACDARLPEVRHR